MCRKSKHMASADDDWAQPAVIEAKPAGQLGHIGTLAADNRAL